MSVPIRTILKTTALDWRPMHECPRDQPVLLSFESKTELRDGTTYLISYPTTVCKQSRNEEGRWEWFVCVSPFITGGKAVQPRMLITPNAWAWPPHYAHNARPEGTSVEPVTADDAKGPANGA